MRYWHSFLASGLFVFVACSGGDEVVPDGSLSFSDGSADAGADALFDAAPGTDGSAHDSGSYGDAADAQMEAAIMPEPPTVSEMTPEEGPWGAEIVIKGEWLGSSTRSGTSIVIGDNLLVLSPESESVVSWTEQEIHFRMPFPHEGSITVKTSEGEVEAGSFTATWELVAGLTHPSGQKLLASVSKGEGELAMLFEGTPYRLVEVVDGVFTEQEVTIPGSDPTTARLYVTESQELSAFALSNDPAPEILQATRTGDVWSVTETGITTSSMTAIAGGRGGATVWYSEADQWRRVRSTTGSWAEDKGPIADPNPSSQMHAAGASSDGALYITRDVDAGNFFDDMESVHVRRLGPNDESFVSSAASYGIDDYLTSVEVRDRGEGIIIYHCGSDIDPWGFSGTDYECYEALRSTSGDGLLRVTKEGPSTRHAFTLTGTASFVCDHYDDFGLIVSSAPELVEDVAWPCPQLVAMEIDGAGKPLPIISYAGKLQLMQRRAP